MPLVYAAAYTARWNELRSSVLAEPELFADIDELAAAVAPAYTREIERWGDTYGYEARYGSLEGEIRAMKSWLQVRMQFLDERLNQPLK